MKTSDVYICDEDTTPAFCKDMLKRFMKHEPGMPKREVARKWFDEKLYGLMESYGMLDD